MEFVANIISGNAQGQGKLRGVNLRQAHSIDPWTRHLLRELEADIWTEKKLTIHLQ